MFAESSANDEATDASYTGQGATGRLTIGNDAATINGALVEYTADKSVWTALDSFTVAGALVFWWNTADGDSVPISMHDFADTAANGSDFEVRWESDASNGAIFTIANV